MRAILILGFTLGLHINVNSQVYNLEEDSVEIYFGGYTDKELRCNYDKQQLIFDKAIYLKEKSKKDIIEIDSFVAAVYIPHKPVYYYLVKGNVFPPEIQGFLKYNVKGISISLIEIFYYNGRQYMFAPSIYNSLEICGNTVNKYISPGQYLGKEK